MICPEEKKERKIYKQKEEYGDDERDDNDDEDFYGDRNVFQVVIRFHFRNDNGESEDELDGDQ